MKTGLVLDPRSRGMVLLLLLCNAAFAQYSIDWFTIDGGGGGGGSGGPYSVTGTIGQPDAGAMANSPYAVTGGFWSVLGTRPWLRIWREGSQVTVAWPVTAGTCQLQQAGNVSVPAWSDVNLIPTVVGSECRVRLPLTESPQYFRLAKL